MLQRSQSPLTLRVTIVVAVVATGFAAGAWHSQKLPQVFSRPQPPGEQMSIAGNASLGELAAPAVLIEFSDFACVYCTRFAREVFPLIDRDYIRTGRLRFIFKNLPLARLHASATSAATAGDCARQQGLFWRMHDHLFGDSGELTSPAFQKQAMAIGLNVPAFVLCESRGPGTTIREDMAEAKRLTISSTPTFVLGVPNRGDVVRASERITGAKSFMEFKSRLDRFLRGIPRG
jgi:protein-disulfide isomerase